MNVGSRSVLALILVAAALVGGGGSSHAKPRRRSVPHQVNLFAPHAITAAEATTRTNSQVPGVGDNYLGAAQLSSTQGTLLFHDPIYPFYERPNYRDWGGLALTVVSTYVPSLAPKINKAPVLPIPMYTSGAYGISLWGRIR